VKDIKMQQRVERVGVGLLCIYFCVSSLKVDQREREIIWGINVPLADNTDAEMIGVDPLSLMAI